MADELTSQIAMVDPTLTSLLGLPENQVGVNVVPMIAPDVQVTNRHFTARVFGKDKYKRRVKVSRPRGGDSERASFSFRDPKAFTLDEKSLKDVLDQRDITDAENAPDGGFDLRKQMAFTVQGNLHTTIEGAAADLFLDPDSYPAGSKTAIGTTFSAAGMLTAVAAKQDAIVKKWAVRPGSLLLTPEAWREAQVNPDVKEQLKHTNAKTLTTEMLAAYLQIDEVIVSYSVWFGDDDDADGQFQWAGKKALLFYKNPKPTLDGPCFAKTFWRPVSGTSQREVVKTAFDMPGNEHFYVVREEETAIVFPDSGHLWF